MTKKQETAAQIVARLTRGPHDLAAAADLCWSMTAHKQPLRYKVAYTEAARMLEARAAKNV